jgi:hypothetical protein
MTPQDLLKLSPVTDIQLAGMMLQSRGIRIDSSGNELAPMTMYRCRYYSEFELWVIEKSLVQPTPPNYN